eukprot:TRINITY_DN13426_c0_g1_i2.p1 TRINITY_DN13426_c0_g1~~TRINITY_DN13426_c0_g1_i2.p1  ORF type:complete len:488 (+),score=166.61 TRINITY_DN13426_c0_g1_i2:84-1547(+)
MAPCRWAETLAAAGQSHVIAHWDKLSAEQQAALDAQLADIDDRIGIATLRELLATVVKEHEAVSKGAAQIEPPPADCLGRADGSDPDAEARWESIGLDLVAQGKCAACVLAGGLGTRLGYSFPKGMLGDTTIGPEFLPSGKSLFQIQAERIKRVQQMAQRRSGADAEPTVWWLVMTVEHTHDVIVKFFERHNFFGLRSDQVFFFQQGVMPCLGEDGRMLLESEGRIATSPDGNAGIYPALRRSGVLDKLRERGVQWVQAYSVDNVLVRVADPVWYGYCQESGADVVAKSIPKRSWQEAVGVLCIRDGKPGVIEYSEIGDARAQETDASGALKYNAANICLQAYSLDFLCGPAQDFSTKTPLWHLARKQIPTMDGKVPGCKLEGFIFDVFAVSRQFRMLQVDRAAEFSAIKNASDSGKPDSPVTALAMLSRLHRKWLRDAGAAIPPDDAEGSGVACEISPLVSYRGEDLAEHAKTAGQRAAPIVISAL